MLLRRNATDRGQSDLGWLQSRFSFSFADYHDPAEMGWSVLRVINDDIIAPATGFGTHGHRDMEIVTYMLEGVLRHGDSMENSELLARPEVQRMSAGKGVLHSEFNASSTEAAKLLQIWIEPDARGIKPEYEQRAFADGEKRNRWRPIVSPDGREGSMVIHQDAILFASLLGAGQRLDYALGTGRRAYLHLVRGAATLNGEPLLPGDALKIADESLLALTASADCEALLFDLP